MGAGTLGKWGQEGGCSVGSVVGGCKSYLEPESPPFRLFLLQFKPIVLPVLLPDSLNSLVIHTLPGCFCTISNERFYLRQVLLELDPDWE